MNNITRKECALYILVLCTGLCVLAACERKLHPNEKRLWVEFPEAQIGRTYGDHKTKVARIPASEVPVAILKQLLPVGYSMPLRQGVNGGYHHVFMVDPLGDPKLGYYMTEELGYEGAPEALTAENYFRFVKRRGQDWFIEFQDGSRARPDGVWDETSVVTFDRETKTASQYGELVVVRIKFKDVDLDLTHTYECFPGEQVHKGELVSLIPITQRTMGVRLQDVLNRRVSEADAIINQNKGDFSWQDQRTALGYDRGRR